MNIKAILQPSNIVKYINDKLFKKADLITLAPAFDESIAYGVGDYVTYNSKVYRCQTEHSAGAWDSSHFTEIAVTGQYVTAGQESGTTLGNCATAEGGFTTASGWGSHAEGRSVKATGYCSHAEGDFTTASGRYSHTEGNNTTASGNESHAEGLDTTASGDGSHVEGQETTASQGAAHAEGLYTTASGLGSHVEGYKTTANHALQHVFGMCNILDAAATSDIERGNYIEIVGNGLDEDAPSNARTLDWDGNEELAGTITIGGKNGITLSVDSSGNLKITKGNKSATITLS